jgi:hypothetical protein
MDAVTDSAFAGDCFAFACLAYNAASSESFRETVTTGSSGSFSAGGTVALSGSDSGSGNYGSTSLSDSSGDSDYAGQVLTGSQTQSSSLTLSGGNSFSLSELGAYANGSTSLSSCVYSSAASFSSSGQQTVSTSQTLTLSGSLSGSATQGNTAMVVLSGQSEPASFSVNTGGMSFGGGSFTDTIGLSGTTRQEQTWRGARLPPGGASLVAKGVDGVQTRGLPGGIPTEKDAHGGHAAER